MSSNPVPIDAGRGYFVHFWILISREGLEVFLGIPSGARQMPVVVLCLDRPGHPC
jgi:hypothetical protein